MIDAIGSYRTLEGFGLRDADESRIVTDEDGSETTVIVHRWDGFQRKPDGWTAYDKDGRTERVTAEQAATINANRKAKQ